MLQVDEAQDQSKAETTCAAARAGRDCARGENLANMQQRAGGRCVVLRLAHAARRQTQASHTQPGGRKGTSAMCLPGSRSLAREPCSGVGEGATGP